MTAQRRTLWAWAGGAAAAAALLHLPSLNLLLDRDEGEYATLAWLWRAGHGLPYRDFLEQKPPLAIAMNAVAQAVFSDGVLGLRLLSLLWIALTVLALVFFVDALGAHGALGRRLKLQAAPRARLAGLGGLLGALLLSGSRTQALAANTETWQTLPLLAALAILFVPAPAALRRRHFVLAGLSLGVASLFKQPVLAGVLLLPLAAQRKDGQLLSTVACTALGALLPWALMAALFAGLGAGGDFLHCTLLYNQGYVLQGLAGAARRLLGLGLHLAPELGAWSVLAFFGWRALGREGASRRWLGGWLAVGLVALAASGRYYPHYAILLLAPLAVLAAAGLAGLAVNTSAQPLPLRQAQGRLRGARALRWLLLALGLAGWAWTNGALWTRRDAAARTLHLYGLASFANAPQAAARLQQLCPPDQKLFIWGDEAQLYYLAQRVPASRFLFSFPFTGEAPAWPDGDTELLAGLTDEATGAAVMAKGIDPDSAVQRQVLERLTSDFDAQHDIPGYVLGKRKP